jgi:hypothetical protein
MEKQKRNPRRHVIIFAAIWLLSYTISLLALKNLSPGTGLGIFLSLLPVVAFALFIYQFIRSVAALDEVQVRMQMEAVVIAFALGLLLLMTLGLLELVIPLNQEDWSYRHLIPYFSLFYFVGLFIARRKFNFDNEKHD